MLNNTKSIYDFSKSRVKKNGRVLSKFELCWELDMEVEHSHRLFVVLSDAFTYNELKEILYRSVNV